MIHVETYADRTDAGEQLADELAARGVDPDIVLGIPRGALPVARPVADRLGVPLDIIAAKKMGAPNNPEFAIGAVASDGSVYRNEDAIEELGVDEEYIEEERERAATSARQKADSYRGSREEPSLDGKHVLIVDDGLATGATAIACVRMAKEAADRVTLAVPVSSPEAADKLAGEADEVITLQEPAAFGAVGRYYRDFSQVTDEEAMDYLESERVR